MGSELPWFWVVGFALQVMLGTAALLSGQISRWWHWGVALGALLLGALGQWLAGTSAMSPPGAVAMAFALGGSASVGCAWMLWDPTRQKNQEALMRLREQQAQRQLLQNGITLVSQNVEMREAIRASKRRNLRSQMNPHFLFNVLTGVQHLLIREQREKALHIFERFRHLLVQSFEIQQKVVGSLEEELHHVQQYIELELQRVAGPFEWSIGCADDVDVHNTPCPLLVLQPLVENAIWHGLQGGRLKDGHIRISVSWEGHGLALVVEDNGRPADEETAEAQDLGTWSDGTRKRDFKRDPKHESRALAILQERLTLFRHKGSFSLTDTPSGHPFDSGMRAKIHLPFWRLQDMAEWREKEQSELEWLERLKPEVKERYEALSREAQAAAREVEAGLKRDAARSKRAAS